MGAAAEKLRAKTTLLVTGAIIFATIACTDGGGQDQSDGATPRSEQASDAGTGPVLDSLLELRAIGGEEFRAIADDAGRVRGVEGEFAIEGDPVAGVTAFLRDHATAFGLDRPGVSIEPLGVVAHDGTTTVRLGQTYRGVPIEAGQLVATLVDGSISGIRGGGLPPVALQTIPAISAAEATRRAVDGTEATVLGIPRRTIVGDVDGALRLVWLVDLATPRGVLATRVDARTGEILGRPSASLHDLVDKDLEVFHDEGTDSDEIQFDVGCGGDGPTAGDEERYYLSPSGTAETHTAWENTIDVIRFFDEQFGWLGFDDDDSPQIEVHAGVEMITQDNGIAPAASYVEHCEDIILGEGMHDDLRILGHEYTHGVQDHVGSLDYEGQSGAIAEGLANVLGRRFAGTMGGLNSSMVMRDYDEGCPPGEDDVADCFDHGNVHTNDGIVEHLFRLIARGGADGRVRPTSDEKSARLAFQSMFGLPSDAAIHELGFIIENVARYWGVLGVHGFTLDDACSVERAVDVIAGLDPGCRYPSDSEDDDGDGIENWQDDCDDRNADDLDGDGIPNPCDDDIDDDGIDNDADRCPSIWDPTNLDTDKDGRGDPCDTNKDNDNHLDSQDNCPLRKNNDQLDADRDGQGDACDDIDGDGVIDSTDNCPFDWNPEQSNLDGDNLGDACESDADGDGVDDSLDTDGTTDNCQWYPNADQLDGDSDGLGDVCDPCPAGADTVTGFTANPFTGGGELPGGLPGGSGDDWVPGTIVTDQDGDGTPDGCDTGGVLLGVVTSLGIKQVAPGAGGTVTVPGQQPPGGTFDLPDPCPAEEGDAAEASSDDVVGVVRVTGAPPTGSIGLVDETGRILADAVTLADGGGELPFEATPGTDVHLRFGADTGPLVPGVQAGYEYTACEGEEETLGEPERAFGGFAELVGRDEYAAPTGAPDRGQVTESTASSTTSARPVPNGGSDSTTGTIGRVATTTTTTTRCGDVTIRSTTSTTIGKVTSTTVGKVTSTTDPCAPATTTTTRPRIVATTQPTIGTTSTTTTTRPRIATTSTTLRFSTTTTTRPRISG